MNYLSICSGIEAFSVAVHDMPEFVPVGFSEIEKFPSQVLEHHYPSVPNFGDMTKFEDWKIENAPDVIVGGTPCQAFSVAGSRRSLSDDRGNLSLVFCEMVRRFNPQWVIWENVPGVLSTKDNAFGCFLAGLVGEDEPFVPADGKWPKAGVVTGPERTAAWRVLDAQYVRSTGFPRAVPQRRRRIFVLSSRGTGNFACAAALFPQSDSVFGDSSQGSEARQEAARDAGTGTQPGSEWPKRVAPTLNAAFGTKLGLEDQHALGGAGWFVPDRQTTNSLCARTGRAMSLQDAQDGHMAVCLPINTQVATRHNKLGERTAFGIGEDKDPAYTLQAAHSHAVAIHPHVIGRSPTAGPQGKEYLDNGQAYTMDSRGVAQAVCFESNRRDGARVHGEISQTLQAFAGTGGGNGPMVQQQMQVRRLTPTECHRLQGFPDGYCDIRPGGKDTPDGPQYKALGNSMAVNVMRWLAERILLVSNQ